MDLGQPRDPEAAAGTTKEWGSVLHEYPVDILGCLAPGILLVVGIASSLGLPLLELRRSLAAPPQNTGTVDQLLNALEHWHRATPFFFGSFAFVGVALMTFVAGHIYFRRDPKVPDQDSFRFLELKKVQELALRRAYWPVQDPAAQGTAAVSQLGHSVNREASCGLLARPLRRFWYRQRLRFGDPRRVLRYLDDHAELLLYLRNDLGSSSAERCEFPYPTFREYLEKRGLHHLTPMVGWKQEDQKDTRSKHWVNVLKIRLQVHYPRKFRPLLRNEAHIRLASGCWYVAGTLRWLALIGLVILGVVAAKKGWDLRSQATGPWLLQAMGAHFLSLLLPLSVLLVAWYLRFQVVAFLHYQRMREVVWVLETAFTAFHDTRAWLQPPFEVEGARAGPEQAGPGSSLGAAAGSTAPDARAGLDVAQKPSAEAPAQSRETIRGSP